jgi:hypothetical protein
MTARNARPGALLRDVLPVGVGTSARVGVVLTVADIDPWLAVIGFALGVTGLLAWADKPLHHHRPPAPASPPPTEHTP